MSEAIEHKAIEQVRLDQQTEQALQLRRRGLTYESIAKALGLAGRSGAYHAVQRGLKKIVTEPAEALRKQEEEKLQQIEETIGRILFSDADEEKRMKAANTLLRVHEKRAKLWGLEAPVKVAQTDTEGNTIRQRGQSAVDELMALVDRLQARQRAIADSGNGNGKN